MSAAYQARIVADGAAAYWPMDDAAAPIHDAAGTRNATITGTPTFSQPGPGTSNAISFGRSGTATPATPVPVGISFTIEAWIRRTAVFPRAFIVGRTITAANDWYFAFNTSTGDRLQFAYRDASVTNTLFFPITFPINTWTYVVLVVTGTVVQAYVNGVAVGATQALVTVGGAGSGAFLLAANGAAPSEAWGGQLADLAIYNKVLAAADITAHYTLQIPAAPPVGAAGPGVAWMNARGATDDVGTVLMTAGAAGALTGPRVALKDARVQTDGSGALLVTSVTAGAITGPTVALPNLRVRTDANGQLVVAAVTAGALTARRTALANLRGRTDANGALVVTSGAVGALTGPRLALPNLRARADANGALSVALTTAQTYAQKVAADGATNYWPLNETSGLVATDVIGGANGTISGGVTLGQPGAIGGSTAMAFNGTTGTIATAGIVLDCGPATQSFSIELWIKGVYTAGGGVVNKGDVCFNGAQTGWQIRNVGVSTWQFIRNNGVVLPSPLAWTVPPPQNVWSHLVVTYNAPTRTVSAYINGAPDTTITWSVAEAAAYTDIQPFVMGSSAYGFSPISLDEVALYPLVLTPAQIAAHYAYHL